MKHQDRNQSMTINDKKDFIKHLPDLAKEKSKTHTIFFATFTFKIRRNKLSTFDNAEKFFSIFRKKLDILLLSDRRQHENRPIVVLFAEKSKARQPDHFHSLIFIHNSTRRKFYKNCVEVTSEKSVPKLDNEVRQTITLKRFLLYPFITKAPKTFRNVMSSYSKLDALRFSREIPLKKRSAKMKENIARADSFLTIDTHEIYLVSDPEDLRKTSFYSAKRFISTAADYILETKFKSTSKQKKRNNK